MKEFRAMTFYTTAELAEKLQMNIQVVARKLQSGEIEGYKMGKDWRIEEAAIQAWLDKISNQHAMSPRDKVLATFVKNGRLTHLPAQHKKRIYILEFFLQQFDLLRTYTEAEINATILKHFDDYCTVRREFIGEKMMFRKGSIYRRNGSYKLSP
jgi:excisionase family DNA binding protein